MPSLLSRRDVLCWAGAATLAGPLGSARAQSGKVVKLLVGFPAGGGTDAIALLPLVVKSPGYDTARDFVPVAGFASFPNALALSGGTPAKNMADYVTWVKGAGGGKGSVGVPAPASVQSSWSRCWATSSASIWCRCRTVAVRR
jgi:tripartite-type tricarboxylate transporter receptor subunit TctC